MADNISALISAIPPSALPIVVVIIGIAYLYFKFNQVEKDRESTKLTRDKDSQDIHDNLLKQSFEIANLKGIVELHRDRLESIDKQLAIVNQELVKLNLQVEHLADALKEQNEIMKEQLKIKK